MEALVALGLTVTVISTAAGFFQASRQSMRGQLLSVEASNNARAVVDVLERDLRLAGACLPITGDFMALDGANSGNEDTIYVRTGLLRADLSCIRAATVGNTPASGSTVTVDNAAGFTAGMRAYIRNPAGAGEYFTVASVNTTTNVLGRTTSFSSAYAAGSGVYAIDDRSYYINHWAAPWGDTPRLMLSVNGAAAQVYAVGVEKLNFQYQLRRNCPSCDLVDLPATEDEWRLVQQIVASITARSDRKDPLGNYARRSVAVNIKPRNLLPQ